MKKIFSNTKKIIKIFAVVILAFAFVFAVGCGGGGQVDPPVVDPPVVDPPVVDPPVDEPIDVSKVKFFGSIFTYDGNEHSITISQSSLPAGVTVEYEGNGQKEIGSYTVTATLKDSKGTVLKTLQATLTINKIKKSISKVKFEDSTFVWEPGHTYSVVASNVPDGVRVEYENNTSDEVCSKNAVAKFYDDYDDELLGTLSAKFKVIYHIVYDADVFPSQTYTANGSTFTLEIVDEHKSDFTNIVYDSNTASTQGDYLAKAIATKADGTVTEYHAILEVVNPVNPEFDDYVDKMFVYFLEGDQSTLNIFMINYENYGFEHQDNTWGEYEKYTEADQQSDLAELSRLRNEFDVFDRSKLTIDQQISYDKIDQELTYLEAMINNPQYMLMNLSYIDQYGGSAADFPTTMEAYQIRRIEDIEDIISYVDSMYDSLMSWVQYALDRAEAGFPFSDFTISNMVVYLDGVSGRKTPDEEKKPYYLIAVLEDKIRDSQELLGLSNNQIEDYISQLDAAFVKFIQGHIDLADALEEQCKGLCPENKRNYLGSYGEEGKALYTLLLQNRLGYTGTIEEYIDFLNTTTNLFYTKYSSFRSVGNSDAISNGEIPILDSDDPQVIIAFLKEFAKTIVPDLQSNPEIDIIYMDETTTENTTTLAYYMKSALDSFSKEYIHLNGEALGDDYLETIKTLAHEGYPGHLYAYVMSKENPNISNLTRVSTNTGHGEGWAKYVEFALCNYIAEYKGNSAWKAAMGQSQYWDLFVYNIYARCDVGISYEGWGTKEIAAYFKSKNLVADEKTAQDILNTLNEIPSQYAPYGYGQALFYVLHAEAQEVLGTNYDEIEFNTMLLEHGWIGLSDLENLYNSYMAKKCHILGIEWNE